MFLDCNADEMLETDYPLEWGFDGIGPMHFRDGNDVREAALGLSDDLILVGTVMDPALPTELSQWMKREERVVLTKKPEIHAGHDFSESRELSGADVPFAAERAFVSAHT